MKPQTVQNLRNIIFKSLKNNVNTQCAIFDLPYYKNIGDVLIWEGELTFLNETGKKIVYACSSKTCLFPELDKNVTVLFQGGGNIGDLYIGHTDFLRQIAAKYSTNQIVVFPQTVYFKDSSIEQAFFKDIERHPNLTFCCRDWKSHQIAEKYLKDKALLLPDMAFCINSEFLKVYEQAESSQSLYIKRNDVEKVQLSPHTNFEKVSDWPPFERTITSPILVNTLLDRIVPVFKSDSLKRYWDRYALSNFKTDMIRTGVRFISPFETVYSERLHGAILSILLGKNVVVMDNSYGKNSTFYDSWLASFSNVKLFNGI